MNKKNYIVQYETTLELRERDKVENIRKIIVFLFIFYK